MIDFVYLIPLFPLLGFTFLMMMGKRLGNPAAGWVATGAVSLSFISTVIVYFGLRGVEDGERQITKTLFEWVPVGDFSVDVGFLVDPLSVTMMLFITGIGSLIHLYSIGYMHHDPNFSKFFVYLNMFIFSMLLLVLGDNLLLTFLGWEGVGACSYLLVSFWFGKEANSSAGKKAFVTNRVGDWGFMVAMFLTFASVGSLDYLAINGTADQLSTPVAVGIVLLLFVGVMGKSAQFPLYLWLPDAMAGPTPVSALIHAATMVTSGVFLLTRVNGLVYYVVIEAFWATNLITWIGAGTALFAATIAVAQTDIKRVLAYSTVSQLGYMILAIGTGSFVAAIFHMITHAFFKALLFLGSGSVIHGMADEQDMRLYGGLRKLMPITSGTFIIGWLAIAGVPPFAGFWSKDEILLGAWDLGGINGRALWAVALITAVLTAFYMSRQVYMTFFGDYRFDQPSEDELAHAWDSYLEDANYKVSMAGDDVAAAKTAHGEAALKLEQARKAFSSAKIDSAKAIADDDITAAKKAVDTAEVAIDPASKAEQSAATALEGAVSVRESAEAELVEAKSAYGRREANELGPAEPFLSENVAKRAEHHPHESSWHMTVPLIVLAFLSIVGGALNLPFVSELHFLEKWLEEDTLLFEHVINASGLTKWILAFIAIGAGGIGMLLAWKFYYKNELDPKSVEKPILAKGWNYDAAVSAFMGGPGRAFFDFITAFDAKVVDGLVNGTGAAVRGTGGLVRKLQSGYVRSYALGITVGTVALLAWFFVRAAA